MIQSFAKNRPKHFSRNCRSGLALAEALIAVTLIGVAATVVGSMVNSAVNTTGLSKTYTLAHNLATEATETVKNVRDTNWLIKPLDKECWLTVNASPACDNPAVSDNNYFVQYHDGQRYLEASNVTLDLNRYLLSMDVYRLDIADFGNEVFDIYVPAFYEPLDKESRYYRMIHFNEVNADTAKLEVLVQWKDGTVTRSVRRKATLYNKQFE